MHKSRLAAIWVLMAGIAFIASSWNGAALRGQAPGAPVAKAVDGKEFPVKQIPIAGEAAEGYFSPDSKSMICNAKFPGDATFFVYTFNVDGTNVKKINDKGEDACTFYFPDGKKIIWTSTRDNLDMPKGEYSNPANYPQGAELYVSDLNGGNVVRMTNNKQYDAEVTLSPDGKWILFGRETDGKMDLYRMRPDGTGLFQVTNTPDWQEGGAQFMPDNKTIIYRAWKIQDQGQKMMPMQIFTINMDGTGMKQITTDPGTNWAPAPAPDGRHFVYVRVLEPRNYEIFMMDIITGEKTRLTYNDAFDGFPAISPDGHWMGFSSSRTDKPGAPAAGRPAMHMFLMDISSLKVGPKGRS